MSQTFHIDFTLFYPTEYHVVVRSLQYLCLTRLNIAFTLNKLSQFMHQPTIEHQTYAKHLLRYLCGTSDHDILLYQNSPWALHVFSNVDWVSNKDDFLSTNAYIMYLRHNLISWNFKEQRIVAHFFIEVEYRFFVATASQLN